LTSPFTGFPGVSAVVGEGELNPVAELAGEVPAVLGDHVRGGEGGEFHEQAGVEAPWLVAELVADVADRRAVGGAGDAGQSKGNAVFLVVTIEAVSS
jgi:hypothetical protein